MTLQNQFLKNTFENGMWMDSYNSYQPQGTYRYARNAVSETDEYTSSQGNGTFLANEQSLKEIVDLPSTPRGKGFVASRDWVVYFFESEIGYVDLNNNTYNTIYNGGCFQFDDCEFIIPKFIFRYGCNELLMYWSSGCTLYKMNIDEMLDPQRAANYCNKCNEQGSQCCSYFELMKEVSIPSIVVERYEGGGAGAKSGSYSFMVQCEDQNGNTSNWFSPSKPMALVGKNGVPGEPSQQTLKVHIKNLDPSYSKASVAVMANIGGVRSWHKLGEYPYNTQGVTVHFSGQLSDREQDLPPSSLFVPEKKYLKARKVEIKDNRLHIYQVKQEKSPNIFAYSSKITPMWVAYAINSEEAHNYKSMERSERYLPAIVYNYADGTHSASGPIFPGGGVSGEALTEYNQKNHYSFWEDENAIGKFVNVNKGSTTENNSRASSNSRPDFIGEENEDTTGSAPSPGDTVAGFHASFGENKKPLDNKDINNNFLDKDAYDKGVEIEKESLANRLADFQAKAPEVYSKNCSCTECGEDSCYDALELWESQDKNLYDFETNTAWHTRNKINPDPTQHPDIESERQVAGSAKGAGQNIYKNSAEAKDKEYKARTLNISGKTSQAGIASKGGDDQSRDRGSLKEVGAPVEIARGDVKVYETAIPVPNIKGCDGQPLYGGMACRPTRLCQMPGGDEIPIVVSAQDGTVSRYQMENKEWGDTHAILLGMAFENIPIPNDEDLPKPLNKTNPFSIVYVERDSANTSIIAKGLATGMFEGNIQGKTYLFGRHGINSGEFIDRSVSDGPEQSRLGSGASDTGFLFHSPTTDILGPVLDVSKVKIENNVSGSGNRLGLYAETNTHGGFWDAKIDNRGYRGSINMNHLSGGGGSVDVSGSSYVEANSVVTPVGGLSTPICNRHRERSVFVAANIGTPIDASFQGDTVDQYCPITNCHAQYVALTRELPNQYGSVEGATYIQLGLEGINADIQGSSASISGTCGDVYISFYTKRRTSYISDKNGNDLTPDKDIFNSLRLNLGMADFWKLPEDGNADGEDIRDPKSRAGTQGPKRCSPGEVTNSQYDIYLPSVAKHLVMFWCESKVQTKWQGIGDEKLGEVVYPRLKTLEFDSDTPKQQTWENCWMNRFYAEHIRPSQGQLAMRIVIRFMVVYFMMNFFLLSDASNINSAMDIAPLIAKAGALGAFLPLIQRLLFNNRMLNRMLGIREWYVDDSEGNLDEYIKQFEDIYCEYDLTLSSDFNGKVFFGMDEYYYTCVCDQCSLGETTNEIYISNKQLQGQSIDNFSRFQANSYLDIPSRYGKLQRLLSVGNGFFAQTTDTILTLQYDQTPDYNSDLGYQLYNQPLSYSEGIPEGNWGTIDPNAGEETKWGFFFVDREHRSINLFNGQNVKEISAIGLKNFWKENIDFCQGGCVDQKDGIFYTMGVDHRHNRLLITKNVNGSDESFTLSFDLERQVWRSFHDYIPNVYAWNRKRMYSVKGSKMYVHDNNRGRYLEVYDESVPFEVEFNATAPFFFEYDGTMIDSEANIPSEGRAIIYNQKSTFNKAIVFNRTQCSGLMNLIITDDPDQDVYNIDDPSKVILSKQGEEWRFNEVGDYMINKTIPMFKGENCNIYTTLNESNIDQSKQSSDGDYTHQILADKNVAYRLTYDNEESNLHQLYLRQVLTQTNLTKQ